MARIALPLLILVPALAVAGCESTSSNSSTAAAPVTTSPAAALPTDEDPAKRNDRLLRLEWSGDQWWMATQKQEWEKVASLEKLIGDYVAQNFNAVLSDMKFGSPRHRRAMAFALGFSRRVEAVPVLAEGLKDTYYEVVLHSLLGLYNLAKVGDTYTKEGDRVVAVPLAIDPEWILPALKHPRPEVRSNAALVLSRVVGPTTSKSTLLVVVSATDDSDAATRVHAIAALGATGDKEVFPYIVKALRDDIELVRIRAALELGRMREKDAVPYLISALSSESEKTDVKRAAAKALVEITGEKLDSLDAKAWTQAATKAGFLTAGT